MATNPLDPTTPADSSSISGGAEHIRDIKTTLLSHNTTLTTHESGINALQNTSTDHETRIDAIEASVGTGALTCNLTSPQTNTAEVALTWTQVTNTSGITLADSDRTFVLPRVGAYLVSLTCNTQGSALGSMPTIFTYVGAALAPPGTPVHEIQLIPYATTALYQLCAINVVVVCTTIGQKLTITYVGGSTAIIANRRTPALTIVPL